MLLLQIQMMRTASCAVSYETNETNETNETTQNTTTEPVKPSRCSSEPPRPTDKNVMRRTASAPTSNLTPYKKSATKNSPTKNLPTKNSATKHCSDTSPPANTMSTMCESDDGRDMSDIEHNGSDDEFVPNSPFVSSNDFDAEMPSRSVSYKNTCHTMGRLGSCAP